MRKYRNVREDQQKQESYLEHVTEMQADSEEAVIQAYIRQPQAAEQ